MDARRTLAALVVAAGLAAVVAAPTPAGGAPDQTGANAHGADFDGDGYDDLVVGAPGESVGTVMGAGNVTVAYGGPDGPGSGRTQTVRQGLDGLPGTAEDGDLFGDAVAAGDFDGDGFDDLAVGASRETVGDLLGAGDVTVVPGGPGGLEVARARVLRQGTGPVPGEAEDGDEFGRALAAGDVDGDGFDDLAVGAPLDDVGGSEAAEGNVVVLFGGTGGFGPATRATLVRQGEGGVAGRAEILDLFGWALAIGDMDGDGHGDLAVGAANETIGSEFAAGNVTIIPGEPGGLDRAESRVVNADHLVCGCVMEAMQLGSALATGDVNADGFADLAVGALGWWRGEARHAGNVSIVFGTADRIDPSVTLDQADVGLRVEADDQFGNAVALGDVDGDGADELVVGSHAEDVGDVWNAGLVVVVRGAGVEFPGSSVAYHQGKLGGALEDGDRFGSAVAAADLSGDGGADVVIGAPGEDLGTASFAGIVWVVDRPGGARSFHQGTFGGVVEEFDVFGGAVR